MATNNAINGYFTDIVQMVYTQFATLTNTSTTLSSGTTPTLVNTVNLCSLTITPAFTTSNLVFEFSTMISANGSFASAIFCLFRGTTLLCTFQQQGGGSVVSCTVYAAFNYIQTAGTTSPITYHIQYASSSTGPTPVYINSDFNGNSFNGSVNTLFSITEFLG